MAERAIDSLTSVVMQWRRLQHLAAKHGECHQADKPEVSAVLEEGCEHRRGLGNNGAYLSGGQCGVQTRDLSAGEETLGPLPAISPAESGGMPDPGWLAWARVVVVHRSR